MAFTTIQGSGANDATSFVGSSGVDTILIQNLSSPAWVGAQAANDSVDWINFQLVTSGYTMRGGQGNDSIGLTSTTALNNAFVNGNAGSDTVGAAAITLSGTTVFGGQGQDAITFGFVSNSRINGNKNQDSITANAGVSSSSLFGGQGNDSIQATTLTGALIQGDLDTDNIDINGVAAQTTVNGNGGNDTINAAGVTGGTGTTLFGGAGNDTIVAAGAAVALNLQGDLGNDSLVGTASADTIADTAGTNTINAGLGGDTVSTSAANTHLYSAAQGGAGALDTALWVTPAANTVSTLGMDVVTGLGAGAILNLNAATAGYTGAAGAALGLVANGAAANTVATAGTDNAITILRGDFTAATSTFVGNVAGSDSLIVYDSNATVGASSFNAFVAGNYVAASVTGIGGNAGIVTLA